MSKVYAYTKNGEWYRHGLSMTGGEQTCIITLAELKAAKRKRVRVDTPREYFIKRDNSLCLITGNKTVTFRLYKIHEANATHAKIEWIKYIGYIAGKEDSDEAAVKLMESVKG